jgi:negative regulator of replication initiation
MRTIQIDDEVWEYLREKTRALALTPNSILRKMLGLDKGDIEEIPRKAYRRPILKALYEFGGSGRATEVLDRVGILLSGILNDKDKVLLSTGEPRWRKAANWVRFELVKEGLLKKNSQRGIWELTEKGRSLIRK